MSVGQIRCPNCGRVNRPGAKFCQQCRSRLAEAGPLSPPPADVPMVPKARPRDGSARPIVVVAAAALVVVLVGGVLALVLLGGGGGRANGGEPATSQAAVVITNPPTRTDTPEPSRPPTRTLTRTVTRTATRTPRPTVTDTPTPAPSPTPLPDALVARDQVNLRAGPGTLYNIIGGLHSGEPLTVVGRNNAGDWVQITTADGKAGWVASSLLTFNLDPRTVPVAQNIPPPPPPRMLPPVQSCPPTQALLSVTNGLGIPIPVQFSGPSALESTIAPTGTTNLCLDPGTYTMAPSGNSELEMTNTFVAGQKYCVDVNMQGPPVIVPGCGQ